MRKILITGAAGFIGSNFAEQAVAAGDRVVILDALTYAGHLENLEAVKSQIEFVHGNICDRDAVSNLFAKHDFDVIVNFAAESHVDRSIEHAASFVETNVMGVCSLLDASLKIWEKKKGDARENFRFIQVSTDEVFGQLGDEGYFTEETPYAPSSPYSSSKAGGDHLARAWNHTYKLPVIVTNCSNNYGPKQFPEKLIPTIIRCALAGQPLPVYGNGKNVRDWIHVSDHCAGVRLAIEKGVPGQSYCFGGRSERQNLEVVKSICAELDRLVPKPQGSYASQIRFVEDRKGHDWRYAIDDSKAERELGFKRQFTKFEEGLKQTIQWYLENQSWVKAVMTAHD